MPPVSQSNVENARTGRHPDRTTHTHEELAVVARRKRTHTRTRQKRDPQSRHAYTSPQRPAGDLSSTDAVPPRLVRCPRIKSASRFHTTNYPPNTRTAKQKALMPGVTFACCLARVYPRPTLPSGGGARGHVWCDVQESSQAISRRTTCLCSVGETAPGL